jgi:hypothetical protein
MRHNREGPAPAGPSLWYARHGKTFWIGGGLVALAVLIVVLVYSGGGSGGY